jgi:hypothetical protein
MASLPVFWWRLGIERSKHWAGTASRLKPDFSQHGRTSSGTEHEKAHTFHTLARLLCEQATLFVLYKAILYYIDYSRLKTILNKMEFVNIARGGVRLCYNGYSYTKKADKKNRIRWECSQRKTLQCKGAVTTSLTVCDLYLIFFQYLFPYCSTGVHARVYIITNVGDCDCEHYPECVISFVGLLLICQVITYSLPCVSVSVFVQCIEYFSAETPLGMR